MFDEAWGATVFEICDEIFQLADAGFVGRIQGASPVVAFLWEADPRRFVEKYPDSDLIESYGQENWPPPCIDYWVYVEPDRQRCRVSVEGWNLSDFFVDATGHAVRDGHDIACIIARILQVPYPPTQSA